MCKERVLALVGRQDFSVHQILYHHLERSDCELLVLRPVTGYQWRVLQGWCSLLLGPVSWLAAVDRIDACGVGESDYPATQKLRLLSAFRSFDRPGCCRLSLHIHHVRDFHNHRIFPIGIRCGCIQIFHLRALCVYDYDLHHGHVPDVRRTFSDDRRCSSIRRNG